MKRNQNTIKDVAVSQPQVLHGDNIDEVPPHLSLLLMLGNKFVPFPDTKRFLSRLSKSVPHELEDLKRVLTWTVFHDKFPNTSKDSYPSFDAFPYKRMFVKKGTTPNASVEEKIQQEVWRIDKSIGIVLHQIRQYIDHLSNSYTTRGVKFNAHLLESFLNKHIVMASDKDGGSLVVSRNAYVYEATAHMRGQLHGHDVYLRVGEMNEVSLWEDKAEEWQNKLKQVIMPFLPPMMLEFLQNFLDFQHKPRLPNFYLLAKTHKEGFALKPNGRFPTRPVVGMFRWATTPSSILLATMGTILLKIDRHHDPLCSPILDTLDLLKRLRKFSSDPGWGADGREWCISTFDFESLYTNFRWSDVSMAMDFWRAYFLQHESDALPISSHERVFLHCLFAEMPWEQFVELKTSFPYMNMDYQEHMYLGKFLMNVVFTHCIFLNEGVAIFLQLIGFAMGTNCAPSWAQLVLRAYERRSPLPRDILLWRYIDDGFAVHPLSLSVQDVNTHLCKVYPKHLAFTFVDKASRCGIAFLDIWVVSLAPLRTSVYWKPSHACTYIPWRANVPRHTKCSWIRGECIRYLRICSHERFYALCLRRLTTAVELLDYPKHVVTQMILSWDEHSKVLIPRRERVLAHVDDVQCSLSQVESHESGVIGGGGRVGIPRVHILRAWHHSAVQLSWPRILHCIQKRLPFLKGKTRLFAILKPLASLRKLFRRHARTALRMK